MKRDLELIASLLVLHGADIRLQNRSGESPLSLVLRRRKGNLRLKKILVSNVHACKSKPFTWEG